MQHYSNATTATITVSTSKIRVDNQYQNQLNYKTAHIQKSRLLLNIAKNAEKAKKKDEIA